MKYEIRLLIVIIVSVMLGAHVEVTSGDRVPEYELITEMVRDVATVEGRSTAIAELMAVVKDSNENMMVREIAAGKLGELEAVEARDMLETLAEELTWGDRTRELKRACSLSYWQIRVAEEPNAVEQEELLMNLLWGKKHPPPHADVTARWAADELANRGVERALPEIIKSARYRNPGERAEKEIWLCKTKIDLLSASKSRLEALSKALAVDDITEDQWLTRWAVNELAKLESQESGAVLLAHALLLQSKYYDDEGRWKGRKADRAALYAPEFYSSIINTLKNSGMAESELKAKGLRPDKFFIPAP
jgi:hypothetical protein